jgi:shikimate kinase
MGMRNIALIGFRATGKTAVGKALAEKLGRMFIDMDQHLMASAGRDIACWVRLDGLGSFRKAESELLEALAAKDGLVVATGGGVVLDPENRRLLRDRFLTVWLSALPETIYARITADVQTDATRPPLTDLPLKAEIEKLLAERAEFYARTADLELATDEVAVADLVSRILQLAPVR